MPNMHKERHSASACFINDYIYIFAGVGRHGVYSNTVERLSVKENPSEDNSQDFYYGYETSPTIENTWEVVLIV